MKLRLFLLVAFSALIFSCGGVEKKKVAKDADHPYFGTFTTEYGMKFQLKKDYTTVLMFQDSITYEGKWDMKMQGQHEFATIEFGGNEEYYFLKDGMLYRKKEQMMYEKNGMEVSYLPE